MKILEWIQNWYASHCDGDWEHENSVKIYTLDNPGWSIIISLRGTTLEDHKGLEWKLHEKNDTDWYGISIKNFKFKASGDPSKLEFLLNEFKELVENHEKELYN